MSRYLSSLLLLGFAAPLFGQTDLIPPKYLKGQTWAVIVGVSDYQIDRLDLSVAADDAIAVGRWLYHDGFPPVDTSRMALFLDLAATRANIITGLEWVAEQAGPDDRISFYFSGHGSPEGLAPSDFGTTASGNLLEHGTIKTILKKSASHQIMLIIDACHSQGSESAIYIGAVSDLLNGYVNSGITILSSSNVEQSSYEYGESGLSYFTHYFLQGIREGYANKNNDAYITIEEAYEYVRLNVQVMTDGDQTPQRGGDVDPNMILRLY